MESIKSTARFGVSESTGKHGKARRTHGERTGTHGMPTVPDCIPAVCSYGGDGAELENFIINCFCFPDRIRGGAALPAAQNSAGNFLFFPKCHICDARRWPRRPHLNSKNLVMSKFDLAHHPSLDEVELRMASHPFLRAKVVTMFYTYMLRSLSHPAERCIGSTGDFKSRLIKHYIR